MTHGSLFSGIGGFDLAAEWMGWENKFHCEWNEFGQRVLNYYWPNAELFTDITKSDFKKYANQIDVLTGGFPCQPYSAAGRRLGKEDERHLWPEMCRAIREIAPRYVVGENVRGLTNWNGGLVFDEVCVDLENLGYQVATYLIPASATNAPHQRERIWFVAYKNASNTSGQHCERSKSKFCEDGKEGQRKFRGSNCILDNQNVANTQCIDLENKWNESRSLGKENSRQSATRFKYGNIPSDWSAFPTSKPTICRGDDGLPTKMDGITLPKWRTETIKAYGNAVCPQVVLQLFKAIEAYERTNSSRVVTR
jgi:DNA (cytosine-5)-methyltransferase 1